MESIWIWLGFNLFILVMIVLDLVVLHRNTKVISIKYALLTSAMWIGMALLFNVGIYFHMGKEAALNFLAGYLIEESLSIDNLFIFIMLFNYFKTPKAYQHKVLFWGILGAIVMRACFIFFGVALVSHFHWILYIFGVFLVYTGIKMALPKKEELHPDQNPAILLLKKFIPMTSDYDQDRFFTKSLNRWHATPLFAVLLAVETTDLIFAIDSIPAVMAITLDPFIIYTSNIFAILGLRSLYFALAGLMSLFHFLNYGLAAILVFVGIKMLVHNVIDIPIYVALGFIVLALGISIVCSCIKPHQ